MAEPRSAADRIALTGAITLREIESVHRDLVEKLAAKAPLEIDCAGVTDADISLVQLILAAEKSGADVSIAQPLPDSIHQVLERSGLAGNAGVWTPKNSSLEN
jgi:ABC-type transporter Mla MlaB component